MVNELIEKDVRMKEIIPTRSEKANEAISYSNIFGDFVLQVNEEVAANSLKNIFSKSIELSENTLDSIISTYYQQMEVTVDFNSNVENAVRELNPDNADKLLKVIRHYFDKSWKTTVDNTKKVMESYSVHTNLASKISEKFETIMELQAKNINQLQSTELHPNEWSSEWWKQPVTEK